MGRPRKHDSNLPPCVYYRHGAFYHVSKGKWLRLGSDIEDVKRFWTAAPREEQRAATLAFAYGLIPKSRQNAKARKIDFALTKEDVRSMLDKAQWRCSVTGTEFDYRIVANRKPFAPSIDRIDNALGYTPENCRVVCVAANMAMNVWGQGVLAEIARSIKKKSRKEAFVGQLIDTTIQVAESSE